MKIKDPFGKWLDEDTSECDSLHRDLFTSANYLIEEGREEHQIYEFMRKACDKVNERFVSDREIKSAIRCAYKYKKGEISTESFLRPEPDFQRQVRDYYSDIDLMGYARSVGAKTIQNPSYYIETLFEEHELICFGLEMNRPLTISRQEALANVDNYAIPYVVPSPMTAPTGKSEEGVESARTKENTGRRRYLVVEFDYSDKPHQLAYHYWLNSVIPCEFIVFSGGKSFHGWYKVEQYSEQNTRNFFNYAVMLGADRVTWSKCQLCRLPAGFNLKHKTKQTVIGRAFFDVAE